MAEGISLEQKANFVKVLRREPVDSAYSLQGSNHIGLLTSLPPTTMDCSGIELATTTTGYARFNISDAAAPTFWSTPQNRISYNLQTILFGPAITSWQKVVGVALFGDDTATTALAGGHLNAGITAPENYYLKFAPGQLKIEVTADWKFKSEELAIKQIRALLHNETFSLPNNQVWIGLGTKAPNQAGDIGELTTTTAPGYERIPYICDDTTWTDPAATGSVSNTQEMEFADAAENWAAIRSFGIFVNSNDPASDPVPWYHGTLNSEAIVRKFDNIIIPANSLEVSE